MQLYANFEKKKKIGKPTRKNAALISYYIDSVDTDRYKMMLYWIKCDPFLFIYFSFLLFHQKWKELNKKLGREEIGNGAVIHDRKVRARDFNLIVGKVSKEEEKKFHMKEHCQYNREKGSFSETATASNRNFLRPS